MSAHSVNPATNAPQQRCRPNVALSRLMSHFWICIWAGIFFSEWDSGPSIAAITKKTAAEKATTAKAAAEKAAAEKAAAEKAAAEEAAAEMAATEMAATEKAATN